MTLPLSPSPLISPVAVAWRGELSFMAACAKGVCERVGEGGQYHHSPISPSLFPNSGRPRNFGRIFRDVVTSDEHFALRVRYCVSSRLAAHIVSLPAHSLHPLGCHLAPYSVFQPGSATEISPPTAGEELEVAKSESWAKFKRRGSRYEKHFARCLGKISSQKSAPPSPSVLSPLLLSFAGFTEGAKSAPCMIELPPSLAGPGARALSSHTWSRRPRGR